MPIRSREGNWHYRFQVDGRTLRANIDETESEAIITEQGSREKHRERIEVGSSFCNQFA